MANATDIVKKGVVSWTDEFKNEMVELLASDTTFYPNAMTGIDITGYLCKADDTQSWAFAGVVSQDLGAPVILAGSAGDTTRKFRIHKPRFIELAIASIAVTDKYKPVYALFDQTGTLDPSATTYANVIGHVVAVQSSGIALVECAYDGVAANARLGAAKWLAATGTQTLTKHDINKTIFCPNTAAHTVNLPAVADCPAGSRLKFVKTTSDAQIVTLDGNSSETIDGATTLTTIDAQYDCAELVSTGAAWIVQNRDIA